MDFGSVNEDDDDDSSSVIDISNFLTDDAVAAATSNTYEPDNDDSGRKSAPSESSNQEEAEASHISDDPKPSGRPSAGDATVNAKQSAQGTDGGIQERGAVRIVMGESILRWRARRQPASSLLQHADPTSTDKVALVRGTAAGAESTKINWKQAHLEVTSDVASLNDGSDFQLATRDILKIDETSNTFGNRKTVDLVAIWDQNQNVYRLEIPQYIVSNPRLIIEARRSDEGSTDMKNNTDRSERRNLAAVDPLTQARLAEEALRKRKHAKAKRGKVTVKRPRLKNNAVEKQAENQEK